MKTLREAILNESLFNKKNLDKNRNKYGITEYDMAGELKGFPVGVVVRMMEEQERQGNEADVTVFQKDITSGTSGKEKGFSWVKSFDGLEFWWYVIKNKNFNLFFDKYPEYTKY